MKKNFLSASLTKAAFALATVLTLSLTFSACSDKNEPEPENPTGLNNQAKIDDKVYNIKSAELRKLSSQEFSLSLYLDNGENMYIHIYPKVNGKAMSLNSTDGNWAIQYNTFFIASTELNNKGDRGTIKYSINPETGQCSVEITDGYISAGKNTSGDNKEHSFILNYNGKPKKFMPKPRNLYVTIDEEEKPIVKAEYREKGNGNYTFYLNLSNDGKEKVQFDLNKDLHMTGSAIELNKKEEKHTKGEYYWWIKYYKSHNDCFIDTFSDPGSAFPVFTTGTFTFKGSFKLGVDIELKNGLVKGTDGKEHSLVFSYSGTMTKL